MNSEKLQKWALIAEIAGGISVVVSLIFVGFQIRQGTIESSQNTAALEASAYQDLVGRVAAVNFEAMTDPEFGAIVRRVHLNEVPAEDPVDIQVGQYLAYTRNHGSMAFVQYQKGLITLDQLEKMTTPLFSQLRTDVGKLEWARIDNLTGDFRSFVKDYMSKDQPNDPFWQDR